MECTLNCGLQPANWLIILQSHAGTCLFSILEAAGTPADKLQAFCEEFINHDGTAIWAWKCLSRVYSATGDHQKSVAALHVVLRTTPSDAATWEELAISYQKMGRGVAALKVGSKYSIKP